MKSPRRGFFLMIFLGMALVAACEDEGDTPCAGIDCSGHGTCHWTSDQTPYCVCDQWYYWDKSHLVCAENDNVNNINNTKPIIYLYPPERTEVTVAFDDPADVHLAFTYPLYPEGGWRVIAWPDGTLEDPSTGRRYYALYWEGVIDEPAVPETEGFVVAGADTATFLEEVLPQLGLNWAEADEFIIYWLPILGEHPYNFIHFLTASYDAAVPLAVTPAPDTVIRFSMRYRGLERLPEHTPLPQVFTPSARDGFVLVEWGGRALSEDGK